MVALFFPLLVALAALNLKQLALGLPTPLTPRIAQTADDTTQDWESACRTAGGGSERCRDLAVHTFPTILVAALPCDQQNAADNLVDFAKKLGNDTADMIRLSQLFAQQPRNSVCGAPFFSSLSPKP